MAQGTCRHCKTHGPATDAPVCFHCGGWQPNPGFCTRLVMLAKRLGALLCLAAGLLLLAFGGDNGGAILYGLVLAVPGAAALIRSLAWPYGRAPNVW